jgi:hypothetical protein
MRQESKKPDTEMTGLLEQILVTLKERPVVQTIITSTEPEVKTETPETPAEPVVAADVVTFNGKTYTRDANAKFWAALDYLRANPDARSLSVRKLAEQVDVSKSLAEQAKKKA